jgi:hypothetical protein
MGSPISQSGGYPRGGESLRQTQSKPRAQEPCPLIQGCRCGRRTNPVIETGAGVPGPWCNEWFTSPQHIDGFANAFGIGAVITFLFGGQRSRKAKFVAIRICQVEISLTPACVLGRGVWVEPAGHGMLVEGVDVRDIKDCSSPP